MDLNEYLETIVEFNKEKPYGIILAQFVFDSFRKYCIDYIQEPKQKIFESLYEIVNEYTDEPFKKYVDELFQDNHLEQFETHTLCLEFFKKFVTILDNIDSTNEEQITDFLDYNIYKYFEILLSDNTNYWFFPSTYEDELHMEIFEPLRNRFIELPKPLMSSESETPVEQLVEKPIKSITRALVRNKHKLTKKHITFRSHLKTRKRIHK
jgi:hypothetical protein